METPCIICLISDQNVIKLDCGHLYHKECLTKWLSTPDTNKECCLCKKDISDMDLYVFGIIVSLEHASWEGNYDIVKFLLDSDIDVNRRCLIAPWYTDYSQSMRWTSLMFACFKGHFKVVQLLLDRGADVNLVNGSGETALISTMLAMRWAQDGDKIINDCYNIIPLLLDRGANIDHRDNKGRTALMVAVQSANDSNMNELD